MRGVFNLHVHVSKGYLMLISLTPASYTYWTDTYTHNSVICVNENHFNAILAAVFMSVNFIVILLMKISLYSLTENFRLLYIFIHF